MIKCDVLTITSANVDKIYNIIKSDLIIKGWHEKECDLFCTWGFNVKLIHSEMILKVTIFGEDQWGNTYSSKFSIIGFGTYGFGVKKIRCRLKEIAVLTDQRASVFLKIGERFDEV